MSIRVYIYAILRSLQVFWWWKIRGRHQPAGHGGGLIYWMIRNMDKEIERLVTKELVE